ncbi:VOC family protein [Lacinutrix sp. Bg11-31]|uniref:VOC family protein n=1 Tax=Lacinutrix sp. Bg11-31 TaxID=2057808 RepID=UPI000C306459|nr:VOC family protein [Lacinutrix sp. Bg11-31]AUC81839.1 glyoxalase family protein [Lacinutrix sp. Bg11-31]
MKPISNTINYIEFKAHNLEAIKAFYGKAFGWKFTDYGENYIAFSQAESGLDGGFEKTEEAIVNGVLVVLYHKNLIKAKQNVIAAGGKIKVDIFSFPGGSRFQFIDPSGNELAVWMHDQA